MNREVQICIATPSYRKEKYSHLDHDWLVDHPTAERPITHKLCGAMDERHGNEATISRTGMKQAVNNEQVQFSSSYNII